MVDGVEWIAVDWGSSRLRAWAIGDGGKLLARAASGLGKERLSRDQFEPALLGIVAPWLPERGRVPVVVCGAAGAREGWQEAAYVPVPCALPTAAGAIAVATGDARLEVRILSGLSQARPAGVLRGEETQAAGFLAATPEFDGTICLPGSHTQWLQVSAQEVVSFRSFLTGELFAAVTGHTVLKHSFADGFDRAAFLDGVGEAMSSPELVTARMYGLRAEMLLEGAGKVPLTSRLSGLLIGLELRGARGYWLGTRVALVGAAALMERYRLALEAQGAAVELADGDEMVLAGLAAGYRALRAAKGRA